MRRTARRLLTATLTLALAASPALASGSAAQASDSPSQAAASPVGGNVVAWGDSSYGQASVPAGLTQRRIVKVSGGEYHSLALTADGTVVAWGIPYYGVSTVPASLTGRRVVDIAAGRLHNMALTDDGAVTVWGTNEQGILNVPPSLASKRVVAIAAGELHSLALTSDGVVVAWGGEWNQQSEIPASLTGQKVVAIAAGQRHSLALTETGSVVTWGGTNWGYSGMDSVPASLTGRVARIAAGGVTSAAVTTDGEVVTWGYQGGNYGTPVPASLAGRRVVDVAVGGNHTVALTDDGTVLGWGQDLEVPATLTGHKVTAVSAGRFHALALYAPTLSTGLTEDRATTVAGEPVAFTPAVADATPDAPSTWTATGDDITSSIDPVTGEVSLSSTRTGTHTATLSIPTDLGTLTATVTVVVAPAAARALTLKVSPAGPRAGDTVSVGVTGADRFGNPTGDESGRVTIASSHRTDTVSGTDVTFGAAGPRTLSASHVNGTIAKVGVDVAAAPTTVAPPEPVVTLPAARLSVTVTSKPVIRGTRTTVAATRLAPRERYTVRIAGRTVARGTADARGRVARTVVVPRTRPAARQLVTVTGSRANRTGRDTLAVVTGELTAEARKTQARASTKQRITVRGLVPGQKVRITYRGRTVSAANARASRNGTFTLRFDVGRRWGAKQVTVRAGDRTARTSFAVTPRRG